MSIQNILLGIIILGYGIFVSVKRRQERNVGIVITMAGAGVLFAGINSVFADKYFVWYMIIWFVGTGLYTYLYTKGGKKNDTEE